MKVWVKRRHPRWMMDFFHGAHGKKSPAFCKKHVELGVLNSPLVFKKGSFCRFLDNKMSIINNMTPLQQETSESQIQKSLKMTLLAVNLQ